MIENTEQASYSSKKAERLGTAALMLGSVLTPKDANINKIYNQNSEQTPIYESFNRDDNSEIIKFENIKSNSQKPETIFLGERSPKEIIEGQGGIFLDKVDYSFEVETPLGAYDKYGNFYPDAIPEGGILNSNGAKFKLTYETGYYDEITFLYPPEADKLKAGQMFPYMIFLPPQAYGKPFRVSNYADSPKSIERDIYIDMRETGAVYLVVPVITTAHAGILPPSIDENGNVVNEEEKTFDIEPGGVTGSTTGYLSWAFMKLTKQDDMDYFDLEFLGIEVPSSDNKLYMELNNIPKDIVDRCKLAE